MIENSRYANERLTALWDRVESLEHTLEAAGAFLEMGLARDSIQIDAKSALRAIQAGIVEDFKNALLCNRDMTDEQLDAWLNDPEDDHSTGRAPED